MYSGTGDGLTEILLGIAREQNQFRRLHTDLTRGPAIQIEGERLEALTKARAEIAQCRCDGCPNTAQWPYNYCEECLDEITDGGRL